MLLILYFSLKIERVKQLIDYITVVPSEDDELKGHRYPFYACEVLTCDENAINELFILKKSELMLKVPSSKSCPNNTKTLLSNSNGKTIVISEPKKDSGKAIDVIDINAEEHISNSEDGQSNDDSHEEEIGKDKDNANSDKDNDINEYTDCKDKVIGNGSNFNAYIQPIAGEKYIDIEIEFNPILNHQSSNLALFDYLLKFLDTDKELNYVLAGYFSKLVLFLLNKYPMKLISYLYIEQQAYLEKIILHSDKKAIGDIALKLLSLDNISATGDTPIIKLTNTNENPSLNTQTQITKNTLTQIRNQMISKLICQIDIGKEDFELDNLLTLCTDLIQSKELLLEFIVNPSILTHLFKLLQKNAEETPVTSQNYSIVLSFLIQLLKYIQVHKLDLPSNCALDDRVSLDPDDINHTPLSKMMLYNLKGVLRNFDDHHSKEFHFQYGKTSKALGFKCLRILELVKHLFYYFKDIPYLLDEILINEGFFKKAIDFFFKYQWNNVYHQHFINIFKLYINDEPKHLEISKHLFKELDFGNGLMDKLLKDKFIFDNTSRAINLGYYSHLIYLCSKINVYSADIDTLNRSRLGSFNFVAISSKPFELMGNNSIDNSSMMASTETNGGSLGPGMRNGTAHESIEIKSSLKPDWNKKFKEKVLPLIQVYESKLCDSKALTQDNDQDENINDFAYDHSKSKSELEETSSDSLEDHIASNTGSNPNAFPIDIQQDTTNFDNDVEQAFIPKRLNEAIPMIESNVIVDELDSKNFTDLFYWKGNSIDEQTVLEALRDLELK